ncbi:ABC transporter ATP-binding protein [Desulfovibrio inopinatus]|uniref:ABC transporter ATP-binding protein n=1 Tax=Desulfovibrio inopinatus TaxID=102109 RepID=UPI000419EAF2|nr:ABC transporter ATP-binding protein [Desulfovibrio inopinatus]
MPPFLIVFTKLLRLASQHRWYIGLAVLLALGSAFLSLTPALAVYAALTLLLTPDFGPHLMSSLWSIGLWAVAGVVGQYCLFFASTMLSHIAAYDILYQLRLKILHHAAKLPMGYFTSHNSGATQKVLFDDIEEIEMFIAHHLPDLVCGVALPGLVFCVMAWFDWRLALVALIPVPICIWLQSRAFSDVGEGGLLKRYHDAMENMNAAIIEYVRGMPVIKIFNRSPDSLKQLRSSIMHFRDFQCDWSRRAAPPWAMFVSITGAPLIVLLPIGLWLYFSGRLDLAVLFLFFMIGTSYLRPLAKVALLGGSLCSMGEGLDRIQAILETPTLNAESANHTIPVSGDLFFEHVDFDYESGPALRDAHFVARAGTVTALVGPSGAGKSTIINLATRFFDPKEGCIRIGDTKVCDLSQSALVASVCAVFQDPFLFTESVHDNIAMGRPGASREEIVAASKAARCHDFIKELPLGYDTRVGAGSGLHISGGQLQRIALARAILKDAPIVLLDEATSYADARNELEIQNALAELFAGKTVLVAAHRLRSIASADQIIVINEGRIVENGHHDTLLAAGGCYASLWKADYQSQDWYLPGTAEKKEHIVC